MPDWNWKRKIDEELDEQKRKNSEEATIDAKKRREQAERDAKKHTEKVAAYGEKHKCGICGNRPQPDTYKKETGSYTTKVYRPSWSGGNSDVYDWVTETSYETAYHWNTPPFGL